MTYKTEQFEEVMKEDFSAKNLDDLQREFLLEDTEYLLRSIWQEDHCGKMRIYLNELEDFFARQTHEEVSGVLSRVQHLNEEQQSNFLGENYQGFYESLAQNFRSSFIMSVIAFVEAKLDFVCAATKTISRSPLGAGDLRGSVLERTRRYLKAFGRFQLPADDDWDVMCLIQDVRNALAHREGIMMGESREKRLRAFAKNQPGLDLDHGSIEVGLEFCVFCINTVQRFLSTLLNNCADWCSHMRQIEFGA